MAVREILKYTEVEEVLVIDLDATVTRLFTRDGNGGGNGGTEVGGGTDVDLADLNGDAFSDERVRVVNDGLSVRWRADAHTWDAIIMDLPDPNSELLAGLFTLKYFAALSACCAPYTGARDASDKSLRPQHCVLVHFRYASRLRLAAPPSAGTVRPRKSRFPVLACGVRTMDAQETRVAGTRPGAIVPLRFLTPQILRVLHIFGPTKENTSTPKGNPPTSTRTSI